MKMRGFYLLCVIYTSFALLCLAVAGEEEEGDEAEEEDNSKKVTHAAAATTMKPPDTTKAALTTKAAAKAGPDEEDEEETEGNVQASKQNRNTGQNSGTSPGTSSNAVNQFCPTVQCKKDPKYFDENGELIVPASMGRLHTICGRRYMFSNKFSNRKSYNDAQTACCALGMRTVALDSKEKQSCLHETYKKVHMKLEGGFTQYRSSGVQHAERGSVVWCSTGTETTLNASWALNLRNRKARLTRDSTCVMLMATNNVLSMDYTQCKQNNPFMCEEVPPELAINPETITPQKTEEGEEGGKSAEKAADKKCTQSKCLMQKKCNIVQATSPLFSQLVQGSSNQTILKRGCGGSFVAKLTMTPFMELINVCCKYGMRNINLDTVDKLTCIDKLFKGSFSKKATFITRATNYMCPTSWSWCESGIPVDPKMWLPGEYPSKEGCAVVEFYPEENKKAGLKYAPCMAPSWVLCDEYPGTAVVTKSAVSEITTTTKPPELGAAEEEIESTTASSSAVSSEQCTPKCVYSKCNTQASRSFSPNGTFLLPESKAVFRKGCGGSFVLETSKKFVTDMEFACCAHNMRIINIESLDKLICLDKLFKDTKLVNKKMTVMTRASNVGCPGRWWWCDSKISVDGAMWAPGTKLSAIGENCGVLEFAPDKRTVLRTVSCVTNQLLLCESIPAAIKSTPAVTSESKNLETSEEGQQAENDVVVAKEVQSSKLSSTTPFFKPLKPFCMNNQKCTANKENTANTSSSSNRIVKSAQKT